MELATNEWSSSARSQGPRSYTYTKDKEPHDEHVESIPGSQSAVYGLRQSKHMCCRQAHYGHLESAASAGTSAETSRAAPLSAFLV